MKSLKFQEIRISRDHSTKPNVPKTIKNLKVESSTSRFSKQKIDTNIKIIIHECSLKHKVFVCQDASLLRKSCWNIAKTKPTNRTSIHWMKDETQLSNRYVIPRRWHLLHLQSSATSQRIPFRWVRWWQILHSTQT